MTAATAEHFSPLAAAVLLLVIGVLVLTALGIDAMECRRFRGKRNR